MADFRRICAEDEILDPVTGRCVKKTGSIGRKLMGETKEYIKMKKQYYSSNPNEKRDQALRKKISPAKTKEDEEKELEETVRSYSVWYYNGKPMDYDKYLKLKAQEEGTQNEKQ